ncbi:hypothetical protein ACNFBT_26630 [Pseudomonas sp. NY15181]
MRIAVTLVLPILLMLSLLGFDFLYARNSYPSPVERHAPLGCADNCRGAP